jgi:hypothetical protein
LAAQAGMAALRLPGFAHCISQIARLRNDFALILHHGLFICARSPIFAR